MPDGIKKKKEKKKKKKKEKYNTTINPFLSRITPSAHFSIIIKTKTKKIERELTY